VAAIDRKGDHPVIGLGEKDMILRLLKFVHVAFGLIGLVAGTWVLFGMLAGVFLEKWTVVFLKCALAVSVTGLLFPFHHFLPTHWAAMFGIYASGIAVLAWRRYYLAGIWALVFVLCITFVLCLNVLVAITHVFGMLTLTYPKLLFPLIESVVTLIFAGFGIFTVKRYRNRFATSLAGRR
jgi:hypothetical protein